MCIRDSTEDSPDYKFQVQKYGHPSRFGYKDLCAQWTLLNWEPEALIQRFKDAGARLFLALANHHDGFDTWNSKHQPWNAMNHGPHRDVVGEWAAAARRQGCLLYTSLLAAKALNPADPVTQAALALIARARIQ